MQRSLISTILVGFLAASAAADVEVTVTPSAAPNVFGSPSWAGYLTNALNSLHNDLGNIGDRATDPTAYEVVGPVVDAGDIIVSNFNSWRGVANPAAPFNNELGNRLHFGLHTVGDGVTQYRLNEIAFNFNSEDSGDILDFAGNFAGLDYSSTRFGIDWGPDRMQGTFDDITYTSGNGMTLVDEIVYVGVGNAFDASFEPGTPQEKLDSVLAFIAGESPFEINTTYDVFAPDGSTLLGTGRSTVTIPAPPALAILSFVCFAGAGRRRRR